MFNEENYYRESVMVSDLQTGDLIDSKYTIRRYWSKTPVNGGYKLYTIDAFDDDTQGHWSKIVFKGNQLITVFRPKN